MFEDSVSIRSNSSRLDARPSCQCLRVQCWHFVAKHRPNSFQPSSKIDWGYELIKALISYVQCLINGYEACIIMHYTNKCLLCNFYKIKYLLQSTHFPQNVIPTGNVQLLQSKERLRHCKNYIYEYLCIGHTSRKDGSLGVYFNDRTNSKKMAEISKILIFWYFWANNFPININIFKNRFHCQSTFFKAVLLR